MVRNYFKIALRNLLKNKLFSAINVIGMAVSLASCFLIGLFIRDELRYDRFHPDKERTFRVYNVRTGDDGVTNYLPIVPVTFAPYMQKDFPEIESTLRMMDTYGEILFDVEGKKVLETGGLYAEANVFDMLSLNVLSGSAQHALEKPNTVALSEPLARKYFGNQNAVGKVIRLGRSDYEITAVYAEPPRHFHLVAKFLISFPTVTQSWRPERFENWLQQQYFTYLKLKPGTDAAGLEAKFLPFVEKYAYPKIKKEGLVYVPHLQNIQDIHLKSSNFEWEIAVRGNAQTVYILSLTAVLLLVIACLNFINLSTARSLKRMKEVGIRKVVGAMKTQLIAQFISESVVVIWLGLGLAIVICEMALPSLNAFSEKELALPTGPEFSLLVFGGCTLLGVLAGSYPAFHLSQFRPAAVLYNKSARAGSGFLRQGLVVLQFMLSFFLITGSMVVLSQNELIKNMDLGFSKDQLVMIPLRNKQLASYEATKQEFSKHPSIVSATIGFGIPGDLIAGDAVIDPATKKSMPTNLFCVDHDYIRTMEMHIIAGRDFSRDFPSDERRGFIINETAVKTFGLGDPESAVGKPLDWTIWGQDSIKHGEVIGVVRDFHFKSLREQMSPVVMQIFPDAYWKLTLRIKPGDLPETISFLKGTYERLDPEWPFTYKFVDENFGAMYRSEQKLSRLFSIFTGLAIGVACLGLFGLVEYSVNQRVREIGIRKVFGASVNSLLVLLTKKYFALVLIAFIVIIPVSHYAATEWLSNFAYHITLSPWMYAKACALIMVITLFTVSFQSLKAAWTNPAEVLKNE